MGPKIAVSTNRSRIDIAKSPALSLHSSVPNPRTLPQTRRSRGELPMAMFSATMHPLVGDSCQLDPGIHAAVNEIDHDVDRNDQQGDGENNRLKEHYVLIVDRLLRQETDTRP